MKRGGLNVIWQNNFLAHFVLLLASSYSKVPELVEMTHDMYCGNGADLMWREIVCSGSTSLTFVDIFSPRSTNKRHFSRHLTDVVSKSAIFTLVVFFSCTHGRRKVHDYFLLLLCKSSIWFIEQHIFKIIMQFLNTV